MMAENSSYSTIKHTCHPKKGSDPFQIEQKLVYGEERKKGTAGYE